MDMAQLQYTPEDFDQLFEEYYDRIFNYILKRVARIEVAEDITSEVFYKALKNSKRFRSPKTSLEAWLYTIAHHQIIDWYRTKKCLSLDQLREEYGFDMQDHRQQDRELIDAEQRALYESIDYMAVQRCLIELPAHYQEVLALKYLEKKKIQEICSIVGKKEGTVKSLLSRGLGKLRAVAQKRYPLQPF